MLTQAIFKSFTDHGSVEMSFSVEGHMSPKGLMIYIFTLEPFDLHCINTAGQCQKCQVCTAKRILERLGIQTSSSFVKI